ncbi:MAG TPA: IPExxxVDY family protein, partial [Flavobacteriales bacterium]|nr:IPExxxVDY family protein [Flavobacteriales bacterium]HRP81921.1 IPExxxVDY family protein [Flavobacteriales bacterium]
HMAKFKLDSDPRPEVFLIAISSHEKDYRLCWALNNSLRLDLARRDRDIDGFPSAAKFPAFDHVEPETQAAITLVGNHAEEGVLLPEQRQADYFLIVDNESRMRQQEVLDGVRRAEFVLAAFPLDIQGIKDGYKLLE